MKEAWRAEPLHANHQGRPLEDLLLSMAGPAPSRLDLSGDDEAYHAFLDRLISSSGGGGGGCRGASPSSSLDEQPAADAAAARARAARSDMVGCGRAGGVRAADGVGGSHILPIYPGADASFSPVCTHVPTLNKGRQEGFESMRRVLVPALAAPPRAR
jgi:hypothetical protein